MAGTIGPLPRHLYATPVTALAAKALAAGATRKGLTEIHWDISKGCESPEQVWRESRLPGSHAIAVHMEVPCRRCPVCLNRRKRMWAARAREEALNAHRNWMVTLTLRPEAYQFARNTAIMAARYKGDTFEQYSPAQQFKAIDAACAPWLNKWLKLVRKRVEGRDHSRCIRYLLVAEAHKSGVTHYHCLLHEMNSEVPILKKYLRGDWDERSRLWRLPPSWSHGFIDAKLRDASRASYLCKYLAKSLAAKPRASQGYGKPPAPALGHRSSDREKML